MTFTKTEQFTRKNDRSNSFVRYLELIFHQKTLLLGIAVLSMFVTGIGLLGGYVFQFLIDNVLTDLENEMNIHENLELFSLVVTLVAVAYLLRFIAQILRGRLSMFMAKRINLPLMLGYYDHVIDLPIAFFSTRKTGDLISRFHDAGKVQEALTSVTLTILIDTVMVGFCGIVLFELSPGLFAVTLVILLTYVAISAVFIRPMGRRSRTLMEENADLSSYLKETIDGVQTVKAFQAEKNVKSHMKDLFTRIQEDGIRYSMMCLRKDSSIELTASIGILVLLWAGACNVLSGDMTLGALITFYTLLNYFLSPVQDLIELQSSVQEAIIAADRLNDIMDASLEKEKRQANGRPVNGDVVLDHVSFRYGNRHLTLKDISMEVRTGQHVALVGESGCGKTTLAKLLMGFYEAETGKIIMGGSVTEDISVDALRSCVAYVPQETFLFSASIRDNLLMGGTHADDGYLESVLDACGCGFVKDLPLGTDTMLEEGGSNLSGGQRQRLAIARALLRRPKILILDEATSNLDPRSERKVMNAIFNLNPDMTVIMSVHRLNTVCRCDDIYVLDRGTIIQKGSHDELIKIPGLYQQMWDSQNPYTDESYRYVKEAV